MDLSFRSDLADFREEVSAFLKDNLPSQLRDKVRRCQPLDRASHTAWQKQLVARGWGAPGWPTEYGGTGWSLARRYVFDQELARHFAPRPIFMGFDMLGPTLMTYGTETQRDYFLPRILTGDLWWCQGFSEPNAGSDLAALQCRAVLQREHYIVNGSKIWTSEATDADWMFGLFRTDSSGKKQHGITALMLEMNSPGLSVEPITTFDGGVEVNQCFFDDVRVPVSQRLGPEDQGWGIAKYMLSRERLGIAEVPRTKAMVSRLKEIAQSEFQDGVPLAKDDAFAREVSQLELDLLVLEATERRYLFAGEETDDLGAEVCLLKVRGSELQQRATELVLEALGYHALADQPPPIAGSNIAPPGPDYALLAARAYFNHRKISIYGGSNEIQKNIVSKAVLGL